MKFSLMLFQIEFHLISLQILNIKRVIVQINLYIKLFFILIIDNYNFIF